MPEKNKEKREKELETVIVIVLGLAALYWFGGRRNLLLPVCALIIGTAALVSPAFARGLHWGWMGLARSMGAVSGKILLTAAYILVLIPLSLFARAAGKVNMRSKPGGGSYFKERDHVYSKDDMIHPW